ncbi:DUF4279 domain-containing protein, partial [Heyndrickxia coagulans]|uniref:DUF4279 domain-containing protein n=1 Tax=Heyndrickxia coagulans TaxID=1398 RepID=UPI003D2215FC
FILPYTEEQLLEIKKDYSVSFLISIVISIRDHYCPSIFFDEHLINFINKIGAEISIDLYD